VGPKCSVGAKVGSCGMVVTITGIVGTKVGYLDGNAVVGDGVVLPIEGDDDDLTDGDIVGDFDGLADSAIIGDSDGLIVGGLLGDFVGVLVVGDDVVVEGEYDGLNVGGDVVSLHGGIHSVSG